MSEELKEIIKTNGIYVKDVVTPEIAKYLTSILRMKHALIQKDLPDEQCPNSKLSVHDESYLDVLLEKAWPFIESIIGEELIPTYAYARLYSNGDILHKHVDRPSCEISMTVQLGKSHHYCWPIYVEGKRFDLAEGEGVIYSGCDSEHWRNVCDGPEGYYSGQVFLHYVRANGKYAEWAGDKKFEIFPYVKFRNNEMDTK
jgi:hypothetical protein